MLLSLRAASVEELLRFGIETEAYAYLNQPDIIKVRDVGGMSTRALDLADYGRSKCLIGG